MKPAGTEVIRSHHALRGVAAAWVLLYHLRDVTPAIGQAVDARSALLADGRVWVDFFFMLSGFILSHVYGAGLATRKPRAPALRRFYLARFARIYPLHLATLLALIAVELSAYVFRPEIADAFAVEQKSWGSIARHLTLTHAWLTMQGLAWNVPSWSISTEAFAYLAFPALLLVSYSDKRIVRALLPVAAAAIYLHTFANFHDIGEQQPLARCLAGFISGMLIYRLWRRRGRWLASWSAALQVAAVVVALWALHRGWSQAVTLVALALLILCSADDRGPVARILAAPALQRLGTLSYSIYMTHWIIYRLYWMYGNLAFSGLASHYSPAKVYLVKVFVLAAASLLLAYLTYRWLELPARGYITRRFARPLVLQRT